MLHIARSTQIGVRLSAAGHTVGLELTDKQQYLAASLYMVDISLTCRRLLCYGALVLPMEQTLIVGIVVIHSRRRIALVDFIRIIPKTIDFQEEQRV